MDMPKLQSYQQRMLDQMNQGFKPGELMLYHAGRRSGKSYLSQWMQEWAMPGKYTIESQALVDGEPWYTVRIYEPHVIRWLRSQDSSQYDHLKSDHPMVTLVDMHEQLYMMMVLKWS
jgi:hypothetical protein